MKNLKLRAFMKNDVQSETGGKSPALRLTAALLTLAMVVAAMAGLFPASVQAQTDALAPGLTLTAVSQSVLLNSGATTVAVPVMLTGDSNKKVASAAFSLDYDSTCLAYVAPATPAEEAAMFAGIDADFEHSIAHDLGDSDGELDIAIFDQDSPKAQIEAPGTVVTVTFVIKNEPRCRVDGYTDISFSSDPKPSLGNPGGQPIAVTGEKGRVTIDWNNTATSFTPSSFTINENGLINTVVGTLASNDPDIDDPARVLTLVAGDGATDNALFTLSNVTPAGATLIAIPSFDFEVKKDYSVRAQVNDGKGGVYEQVITITVVDVNETPTVLALNQTTVVEDVPAGTLVATVSVTDPDNFDAYSTSTPDTFTMALSGDDAAFFDVPASSLQITVKAGGLPSYETRDSYTFDVVITDNAEGIYGNSNTYKQMVTINVINHSELSIRTVTASRPPLWTTVGGTLLVPVNFKANHNKVSTLYFELAYDQSCLRFDNVTKPGDVAGDNDGMVVIKASPGGAFTDGDIFTLIFQAVGGCKSSEELTNPVQSLKFAAAEASDGSNRLPLRTHSGEAYVIPNDARGDCNSDTFIDAADFTAIALEIFDDADSLLPGSKSVDDGYWLNAWNVYGADFKGSPLGCDASPVNDVAPVVSYIEVADILCTVSVVFGDTTCTTPRKERALNTPMPASLNVSTVAGDANTVDVTLSLASSNSAAGAAFSLTYDPAQLAIDPTDVNQDGIPDAIVINGPADYLKLAQVSFLNDQVDFALVDTTAPLSAIGDGVLATVRFNKIGAGEPKVTVTNLSVGDSSATTLPTVVEYAAGMAQAINRIFLPAVVR